MKSMLNVFLLPIHHVGPKEILSNLLPMQNLCMDKYICQEPYVYVQFVHSKSNYKIQSIWNTLQPYHSCRRFSNRECYSKIAVKLFSILKTSSHNVQNKFQFKMIPNVRIFSDVLSTHGLNHILYQYRIKCKI